MKFRIWLWLAGGVFSSSIGQAQVPDVPFDLDADAVFLANFDMGAQAEDKDGPNLLKATLQFMLRGRYQTPCVQVPPHGAVGVYQVPNDFDSSVGTIEMWVKPGLLSMGRHSLLSIQGSKSLDGDEYADLIVGAEAGVEPEINSGAIYFGDGLGAIDLANPAVFPSRRLRGVATADLDGDEIPDLVTNQYEDDVIEVYLGPIAPLDVMVPTTTLSVVEPQGLTLVDVDNDGDRDILVTSFSITTPPIVGFENDGTGGFTEIDFGWLGAGLFYPGAEAIAVGDVNQDGVLDILFGAFSERPSGLVYGFIDTDGTYQLDILNGFEIFENGVLGAGLSDLNQDGWLDVVLAQPGGAVTGLGPELGQILIYWNNKGSLAGPPTLIPSFGSFTISADDDIDNDGYLDIISAQWQALESSVFHGPDFTRTTVFPVDSAVSFTVEDLDRDGFKDLFFRSSNATSSPIYYLDENGQILSTVDVPTEPTLLGMGVHASSTGSTPYGTNFERPSSFELFVEGGELIFLVSDRESRVYQARLPFPGPMVDVQEGFHFISAEWSTVDGLIQLTLGDPSEPTNVDTVMLDPISVFDVVKPDFRIGTDRKNQFPARHWNIDEVRISNVRRSTLGGDGGDGDGDGDGGE